MTEVIIITLAITVILLSIRLCKSRKSNKKNMEYISRLQDIIEAQKEKAEQAEELMAENQRLLAEQAMKPQWTIGSLNKEPKENNKNNHGR
jgi:uncharacterized protein YoxC